MQALEPSFVDRIAIVFGTALAASYGLGFLVQMGLARCQVVDRPNLRSSHDTPTPRGGGLGIMIVVLAGAVWAGWAGGCGLIWSIIGALTVLAAVSFWDDRESLSWKIRIGVQAVAAAFVAAELAWRPASLHGLVVAVVVTAMLAVVFAGYANAFNFMDGINGIAGGQALVSGLGTALVAIAVRAPAWHPVIFLSLLVAGAAGGFLPHNFPRATMFMGDVGSVPCGFLLAVLAAWGARDFGWWLLVPLGLLHANFVLDTAITVVRRILRGEPWHDAHREHFYQRLIRAGWSHSAVTGCEMALQVVALGVVLTGVTRGEYSIVWMVPVVSTIWLAFFGFCEREFRRYQMDRGVNGG